ncbi:MAG: TrmH family RNA methyltransferase [Christensenellales bacterium]|jgi:TrmH family RNA methyltransferase
MKIISSARNENIKLVKSLLTKKGRNLTGLFVAEGGNLVKDIPIDYPVCSIFLKKSVAQKYEKLAYGLCEEVFMVDDSIFNAVSDTASPAGILAVCSQKQACAPQGDKILVLDTLQDPGNLGTVLRSCAAFGFYDIIGINCADFYSPKVVRASMSAVFKLNFIEAEYPSALEILRDYAVFILDASGSDIRSMRPNGKIALVLGNESAGVNQILKNKGKMLGIPMSGEIESLNAAVAASIAMFQFIDY